MSLMSQPASGAWSELHQRSYEILQKAVSLVVDEKASPFDIKQAIIKDSIKFFFPEVKKELAKRTEEEIQTAINALQRMLGDVLHGSGDQLPNGQ